MQKTGAGLQSASSCYWDNQDGMDIMSYLKKFHFCICALIKFDAIKACLYKFKPNNGYHVKKHKKLHRIPKEQIDPFKARKS